jgi:hypothetical protein
MNSRWVCRLKQRPWTLPLATSSAANKLVVPWRVQSWVMRAGSAGRLCNALWVRALRGLDLRPSLRLLGSLGSCKRLPSH